MKTQLKPLTADSRIAVPAGVAVCPYCGAALRALVLEIEQNAGGAWVASEVECECTREPSAGSYDSDGDDPAWVAWSDQHKRNRNALQAPVELRVMAWANTNYTFAARR